MKSDFICERAEVTESQLEVVRAAFFYSQYNIVQCVSQQPNVSPLWLYTFP